MESVRLEISELEKEVATYGQQITAVEEAIKGYEEQVQQLTEAAQQTKVREAGILVTYVACVPLLQ